MPPPLPGRKALLFTESRHRIFLRAAVTATLLQFIAFKIIYPHAGFINGDSYVYLESAIFNADINTYPVGYSKFLRIFSAFTRSDTALVAFQYFAIETGALALLYTLFDIFSPRRLTRWLMFGFAVLNPAFLFISNYVSSDALFLALSLCWFTLLIRLLDRPTTKLFLIHLTVLAYAFTVRYNALYYPAISAVGFLLVMQPVKKKLAAIVLSFLPIVLYIVYCSNLYFQFTGIRQFTPFSGWQLANNALYAYRYVDHPELKTPPPEFQPLDRLVRHYFDTTRDHLRHPEEMLRASTIYMWTPQAPLQKFMSVYTSRDSTSGFFKRWAMMGPLYSRYGAWLIRQYPRTYFQYYLLQNAIKFYAPPGEFLFEYNMGRDTVTPVAQSWFRYPSRKLAPAFGDYHVKSLEFLPAAAAIMNILFLLGYLGLLFLTGPGLRNLQQKVLFLTATFWVANFIFSVIAAPVTLRYQLFSILVAGLFALLLIDRLHRLAFAPLNTRYSVSDSGPG